MARTMQIIAKCDSCGITGEESQFDMDRTVDISGMMRKPRLLDLCTSEVPDGKDCSRQFIETLQPWIDMAHIADTAVQPASGPAKATTSHLGGSTRNNRGPICDVPGCSSGAGGAPFVAKSQAGLSMHKSRTHDIPGASYDAARRRAIKSAASTLRKG